jgi:uncharacterized protein YlxW (UPF0749 family)
MAAAEPAAAGRPPRRPRVSLGAIGVVAVLAAAGVLFATSAETARAGYRNQRADLSGLYRAEAARRDARAERVRQLQAEVDADTRAAAKNDKAAADLLRSTEPLRVQAGVAAVSGPGLVVSLDDAPPGPGTDRFQPDDLVVHQQDVQAVVNALWAGGAEAMMLQDQRVVASSAVRCVGNTLILQGRVYSPPYVVTAIGDATKLRAALEASQQVKYYLQFVAAAGLGWEVSRHARLRLPAFDGSLSLHYAAVPGSAAATTSSSTSVSSTEGTP